MLLAIDIGNTNIVVGIFNEEELRCSWRIATRKHCTADEYGVLVRELFDSRELSPEGIEAVVICSVVPPLNEVFEQMAETTFQLPALFIEADQQNAIPIHYSNPSDVGSDRIVNAMAVFRRFGGPAIVVDFGTATTFDAIGSDGSYLGGIIAPGIGISTEALFLRAAKLPRIEIRRPPEVIGTSTVSSMQSGIYFGYLGLVDGILRRMKEELPGARVIATGGLAGMIAAESEGIDSVEENLTLFGLKAFHSLLVRKDT